MLTPKPPSPPSRRQDSPKLALRNLPRPPQHPHLPNRTNPSRDHSVLNPLRRPRIPYLPIPIPRRHHARPFPNPTQSNHPPGHCPIPQTPPRHIRLPPRLQPLYHQRPRGPGQSSPHGLPLRDPTLLHDGPRDAQGHPSR